MAAVTEQPTKTLTRRLAKIGRLLERNNDTREHLERKARKLAKLYIANNCRENDDEFNVLIDFLYWNTPVELAIIASLLGMSVHRVRYEITPIDAASKCECLKCGEAMNIIIRSRSESEAFDARRRKINSEAIQARLKRLFTCKKCVANEVIRKQNESKAYWKLSKQKEQQRESEERQWAESVRSMPYKEYLETEHWQGLRKMKLRQSHGRCQLCDQTNVILHVHHKCYDRLGQEYLTDLIVLCEQCHKKYHGVKNA